MRYICVVAESIDTDQNSVYGDPIVQCLTSDKGKLLLSQLQQTLGAVRKAECATQDRRYIPRILSAEEYQGIS